MKTPAARSTRSANSKKPKKLEIILGVLVVVIVAASALLIYHNHQNQEKRDQAYNADKAKFAQVETDMQKALKTELLKKSCSHVSLKFEEGELYCSIVWVERVEANNLQEIGDEVERINNQLTTPKDFALESGSNITAVVSGLNPTRPSKDIGYRHEQGMPCYLNVDATELLTTRITESSANNIKLTYKCRDRSSSPIYSLAE